MSYEGLISLRLNEAQGTVYKMLLRDTTCYYVIQWTQIIPNNMCSICEYNIFGTQGVSQSQSKLLFEFENDFMTSAYINNYVYIFVLACHAQYFKSK